MIMMMMMMMMIFVLMIRNIIDRIKTCGFEADDDNNYLCYIWKHFILRGQARGCFERVKPS